MSNYALGIDTSKHQGSKVDYAKAKKAGVEFVFLRVGCGKTKDSCFEKDYASAISAGLKVGVYFYTYSTTEEQAGQDASRVLGWLNNRHLDLPVVYDLEDSCQKGTDRRLLNSNMYNKFAGIIASHGYKTMLYTGEYFFNNYFANALIKNDLWIAKYSTKQPSVAGKIAFWQFTSDAVNASYYSGKLDRNYMLIEDTSTKKPNANPYPVPTRTLKKTIPCMRGNDVKWLQTELHCGLVIDGIFGNDTKKAVMDYQRAHGLLVDGIVGSATRYALLND